MNKIDTRIIIFGIIGIVVIIFMLIFLGIIPGLKSGGPQQAPLPSGTISMWVIGDQKNAYETAITRFKSYYPDIEISVRTFSDESSYSRALLDALASRQGPDIFMVDNASVLKNAGKIEPLPTQMFPLIKIQSSFPRVVEKDFMSQNGSMFALPLSIDTLVMIYNKDIFDNKGVAKIPETWEEFKAVVPRLTSIEGTKEIRMAAAAIGGSEKNVDKASDLIQLLMMQSGAEMTRASSVDASFSKETDAVRFYMGFSNPKGDAYTWNAAMPPSLDAFADGRVAILFNYKNSIETIRNKNQWINIGIAPVPYPEQASCKNEYDCKVSYARYFGYTVSKQSKLKKPSWDFILMMTTQTDIAEDYMYKTGKAPALRSLIEKVSNDPEFAVLAKQALIARSWQQPDREAVSRAFSAMADSILEGRASIEDALAQTEDAVNHLFDDIGI